MPAAVALNSAQWNIAQVLGPVLTGVVLATAGAPTALGLSALGFAGFFGAAALWRPPRAQPKGGLVRVHTAGRVALRYARRSRALRAVLVRTVLFVLPGSAMLALLPLVARRRLHEGASGYGLLLSLLGAGALLAVTLLPRLAALGSKALLWLGMLVLAATLAVTGFSRSPWVVWPALFVAGTAWLVVPTTLVVAAQRVTPVRIRSRGLGMYLVTYQAALATGSALAGLVAGQLGIPVTLFSAAVILLLAALVAARMGLPGVEGPAQAG
jgi:predicted MFS family arabinose efflux permease